MINQKNVYSIIALITPGIIKHLMDNRQIDEKLAGEFLYNSFLYTKLEDEETRLWRLSPLTLYDLLEEELTTGEIIWPEEQV